MSRAVLVRWSEDFSRLVLGFVWVRCALWQMCSSCSLNCIEKQPSVRIGLTCWPALGLDYSVSEQKEGYCTEEGHSRAGDESDAEGMGPIEEPAGE